MMLFLLLICYCYYYLIDNVIDGEVFLCFIERVLEQFILVIGYRMKFFKEFENFQKNCLFGGNNVVEIV